MDPFSPIPIELPEEPIIGLDFGKKVVGLAYFHPLEDQQAIPYDRIIYQNDTQVIKELENILKRQNINVLVIGIPLNDDGSTSKMSQRIIEFSKLVRQGLPELKIYQQNEIYSSKEAKELMESSALYNFSYDAKKVDQISASIILNRFIKPFFQK